MAWIIYPVLDQSPKNMTLLGGTDPYSNFEGVPLPPFPLITGLTGLDSHLICLCFLRWLTSNDETSTKADPSNLSLFLEVLSASCLLLLSHIWISILSSLTRQVSEGDTGNMLSLECFSSQISLPSPQSFTGDILEHMGATETNKYKMWMNAKSNLKRTNYGHKVWFLPLIVSSCCLMLGSCHSL